MTDEQALTLARLTRDFNARSVRITFAPMELPDGYVSVAIDTGSAQLFVAGIAPNGEASS